MYSTVDPWLPYWNPEIESWAHTGIKDKSIQCRQLDIDVLIARIGRPVRREMQNIVNDHYTF